MIPRRAVAAKRRRHVPVRAVLPGWLFDHHPAALALAGLSGLLAIALFVDTPLHLVREALDPALHRGFAVVTRLGKSDWSIALAALLCLWFAQRSLDPARPRHRVLWDNAAGQAGFVLAAVLASGIAANLLKWGLGRVRPNLVDGLAPFGFSPIASSAGWASFPSGHATTIVALAVALGFLWPKLRLAFLVAALWIAVSRVIVGAHWASDVVAGIALGLACAHALRLWYARRGRVFVLRRNRLEARRPRLGPLLRADLMRVRDWLHRLVGGVQTRLTGEPRGGAADSPD